MRKLYSLAMYLGLPLILAHLAVRGLRDRDYLRRWSERFGFFTPPAESGGIVVHAASVGEVNAATPLIEALNQAFPDFPMTVTTFTPTGSGRVMSRFSSRVFHTYAPLDLPGSVKRFFRRLQPRLLIVMETEIWPNLYATAKARSIPVLIANGRMSARSERAYRRWQSLIAEALDCVSCLVAMGSRDAERFISCGMDRARTEVAGNLKFDVNVPAGLLEHGRALRARWGANRPVLLAGSTHEEDDRIIIQAFRRVLESHSNALLILAPRHPERFGPAGDQARKAGLRVEYHSNGDACSPQAQCFVIDAMGELLRYYACCDVAIVGGSFAAVGGHNVLEPAALGRPVIVGPHTRHFEEITQHLLDRKAALRASDSNAVAELVAGLFADGEKRDRMGRAALSVIDDGRGALERNLSAARRLLES